jgi:UDP-glucose 4-epimerase
VNPIAEYLNSRPVPVLLGFDPMLDLVHEEDVVRAIILALEAPQSGVYNVPGPGPVPVSAVLRILEATPLPIPHVFAYATVRVLRTLGFPYDPHHVDYMRYPLVLDGARIRDELGYKPQVSLEETIRAAKRTSP